LSSGGDDDGDDDDDDDDDDDGGTALVPVRFCVHRSMIHKSWRNEFPGSADS